MDDAVKNPNKPMIRLLTRQCEICREPVPRSRNSVVCGDHCKAIRQAVIDLDRKFFPTHGCDNCWGDLHGRCTEQCRAEFRASGEFMRDLWALVRLIYNKTPGGSTTPEDAE